jgi:hypothetical protein
MGTAALADYEFDFGKEAHVGNIAALSTFRGLQAFCNAGAKGGTGTMGLDATTRSQCNCSRGAGDKGKGYGLWEVANFFLNIQTPDINAAFLDYCTNQKDIPAAPPPPDAPKIPDAPATEAREVQTNINICNALQKMGLAQQYDLATQTCNCVAKSGECLA